MNLVRRDPFREPEEVSTRFSGLVHQPLGRRLIDDEGSLMAEWALGDDAMERDVIAYSSANVMVTASEADDRLARARAIHEDSLGRDGPFVAVCPAIDGQIRAADVDAWFGRAARGTLFIDDVSRLGLEAQARLSSLLSAQSPRLAGVTVPETDGRVRVIAGSGRSLLADVTVGAFDDVLFYRLNVIHIDRMHQDDTGAHTMKAREVMSQPPYTCGPTTDLATVAKIMWDHDCGFVPVVDASGAVAGVITDRDICIATSTRRLLPEHISAAQAMASPIHACLSDDNVSNVLATMKQFRIRRVPVIDAMAGYRV